MSKKIKIVAISDTHGLHNDMYHPLPEGDILVHAGDFCNSGSIVDVKKFNIFLKTLSSYKNIVIIAGNHDWAMQKDPQLARDVLLEGLTNVHYLIDEELVLEGIKFYGSPWQPEFCNWAFNLPRGPALAAVWSKVPDDTDILITHGPPDGDLGGMCNHGGEAGCKDLLARIQQVEPKYHIFGHIHEQYGIRNNNSPTTFINASTCTLGYVPSNKPIIIEYEVK